MKKTKMLLQKRRPHILVEKLDLADDNSGICSVLASGYLRGPAWNVNHLVHIQGWGDFQIGRIFAHADPHPLKQNEKAALNGDDTPKVLVVADESRREPLQSEIVPDPMDAEQTWPDEFDLADDAKMKNEAGVRKVPKGTSSYQAAWIVDDDDGESASDDEDSADDEDEEHGNEMEMEVAPEESEGEGPHMEEMEDMMSEVNDDDEADDLDEVEKYRRERENAQFPDEIDTPLNDLARIRFQKYRGLKSFRTSPWDPKENLPSDYARIFQFQNYKKTRKTVLSEIGDYDPTSCVFSGQYVTLQIDRGSDYTCS
ncbi:AARP2CN domain protein [Cooperia oncophora]